LAPEGTALARHSVRGRRRAPGLSRRSSPLLASRPLAGAPRRARGPALRRACGPLRGPRAPLTGEREGGLPGGLVPIQDPRPGEALRRRAAVGADRPDDLRSSAEGAVRGEQLAWIVALHDDRVAERDGVVLTGPADVRDPAGCHDLQTDEAEWLLLGVREHAVRRLVHRAEAALRNEIVEEADLRVGARDRVGQVAHARLGRERDAFDPQALRADP